MVGPIGQFGGTVPMIAMEVFKQEPEPVTIQCHNLVAGNVAGDRNARENATCIPVLVSYLCVEVAE